jgi:flavin reductase (DIM6/NTAB) family NADH-FMN oxidoreductase RutF
MMSSISNMVNRSIRDQVDWAREEASAFSGSFDGTALKSVVGKVPSGVVAPCPMSLDGASGSCSIAITAPTFMPVPLNPAVISVCVQRSVLHDTKARARTPRANPIVCWNSRLWAIGRDCR